MYRADLHLHSRFSRATSKKLTVRNLAAWASIKGVHLMGTGDITHPEWRKELKRDLIMDDTSGFYRLKTTLNGEEIYAETGMFPPHNFILPSFVLQGEISLIYKQDDATRKVHNLVFVPNFDVADAFSNALEKIGNIHSDGRPILGLSAYRLLAMLLEYERSYLVPAHVWTPWFSIFGSRSGFDSLAACFGDLSSEIFAMETGLSSDPPMNRIWSGLDKYTLISNSDAHSGENIGREVNIFQETLSYDSLFSALKRENSFFKGTLEFFPDEGKYYLDGHRNCDICFEPKQSIAHNNICPVCHRPLTLGVLYRTNMLADRDIPIPQEAFKSVIPLAEILAEILACGVKTKKVHNAYQMCIQEFGCELDILQSYPLEDITIPLLKEALYRMRQGQVIRMGGFDGEYGRILLFTEAEKCIHKAHSSI